MLLGGQRSGDADSLGLSRADWVLVEYGLAALEFDVGVANRVFDGPARAALAAWQRQKGLPETGHLTEELRDALLVFGAEDDAEYAHAKGLDTVRLPPPGPHRRARRGRYRRAILG